MSLRQGQGGKEEQRRRRGRNAKGEETENGDCIVLSLACVHICCSVQQVKTAVEKRTLTRKDCRRTRNYQFNSNFGQGILPGFVRSENKLSREYMRPSHTMTSTS